jgi:kumamolisin
MTDKIIRLGFIAFLIAGVARADPGGHLFPDSLAPMGITGETVVRTTLTAGELAAPMDFDIALRMRNADELQSRIGHGEKISPEEMEAKHLPLLSDYNRIAAWLASQGFTLILADSNHTNIFARGTVAQVAQAFGVTFARVSNADGEFTSAVSAPSLPPELAGPVLSIDGLQQHIRAHPPRHRLGGRAKPDAVTSAPGGYFTPADINAAYNVPATLTGSGQTIAIIMDASVKNSDLTAFWSTSGLTQTVNNVTVIPVPANSTPGTADADEASLDVEWAGGMAPGAKIRLYALTSLTTSNIALACTQILNDASANHITVVLMSFGGPEAAFGALQQGFASMVAAGITPCSSSGDGGSRPSATTGVYGLANPLGVSYPASDQNVIGVGGTAISFNVNAGYTDAGEVVWFQSTPTPAGGSGGGFSNVVARPFWQTGPGVPSTVWRCVPDVAAISLGSSGGTLFGGFTMVNGSIEGAGGTSLSVQVFGGLVALINQARATNGLGSLGALGPFLYPLNPVNGSGAFTDITSGSNGTDGNYPAGPGYDLCSGLGSPNVTNLVLALGGVVPPTITSQPQSASVTTGGAFSFSVSATGGGTLAYQWFLNGSAISGAVSSTFSKGSSSASDAGAYTVVVSNAAGSATSAAATLTVNAPAAAAASSSGGGGGGAPSRWFYGALALACAIRWRAATKRRSALTPTR